MLVLGAHVVQLRHDLPPTTFAMSVHVFAADLDHYVLTVTQSFGVQHLPPCATAVDVLAKVVVGGDRLAVL